MHLQFYPISRSPFKQWLIVSKPHGLGPSVINALPREDGVPGDGIARTLRKRKGLESLDLQSREIDQRKEQVGTTLDGLQLLPQEGEEGIPQAAQKSSLVPGHSRAPTGEPIPMSRLVEQYGKTSKRRRHHNYHRTGTLVVRDSVFPSPSGGRSSPAGNNGLDPANLPACESHFDAVRVRWRLGQNILNNPAGQFAGGLILFKHNIHGQPRPQMAAHLSVIIWHKLGPLL